MKDKKNNDLKVFQSNKMTLATYNFTANQKNIVYKILVAIKDNLYNRKNEMSHLKNEMSHLGGTFKCQTNN